MRLIRIFLYYKPTDICINIGSKHKCKDGIFASIILTFLHINQMKQISCAPFEVLKPQMSDNSTFCGYRNFKRNPSQKIYNNIR